MSPAPRRTILVTSALPYANGAPHLIDMLYERRPPHEELGEADAPLPVF